MSEADKTIPENSKENLDKKLDHAIKETFPTSDPISVTITKGGAIDYDEKGNAISGPDGTPLKGSPATAENLLDQAKETVSSVAGIASEAAREAYRQGDHSMRQARERYPDAERVVREGTQAIRHRAAENPWLMLLGGVATGYTLAWMIHGGSDEVSAR